EGVRRLVERAMPDADAVMVDEGVRRFLAHYDDHLLDDTVFYSGIEETLVCLDEARVALTVLTNKFEGLSRRVLDGLGVAFRFRVIVGGDSLATRKPDPSGLAQLRRVTGSIAEWTFFVGDSIVDVTTA